MVLHGDNDYVLDVRNGEYLRDAIKGSEYVLLEGEGHMLHGTRNGMKLFVENVLRFLGKGSQRLAKL